jgi:hypothetical protein
MAHFAELDADNIVVRVIVVNNAELLDANGQEREAIGVAFCQSLFGGTWVQTSYNGNFRARFAGQGYAYDANHDAFIAPKPFPSWLFSENALDWVSPVPHPEDGKQYLWDENTTSWVEWSPEEIRTLEAN